MDGLIHGLLRRLGQAAVVAFLVATACFAGLQALPGDLALHAAAARYGDERVTAGNIELLRHRVGLDRPLLSQYGSWIGRLASGDLGRSFLTGKLVSDELSPRLVVTLGVGALAAGFAVLLSAPLGIAAGLQSGRRLDRGVAMLAAATASAPTFVVGTLLVAVLAVRLRWLPTSGAGSFAHLVLPAGSLALSLLPGLARVARHAVAGVARAPYTIFARMRGVAGWRIALQVAGRPALIPVAAYLPVLAMQLIEGFVTVELVFNLDGIGTLLMRSLLGRDMPVVMGAGITFVLLLAVVNALTDVLLRLLDPRPSDAVA